MNYAHRYQEVAKQQVEDYHQMHALPLNDADRAYWQARYQALRIEARALERRLGLALSETKRG